MCAVAQVFVEEWVTAVLKEPDNMLHEYEMLNLFAFRFSAR